VRLDYILQSKRCPAPAAALVQVGIVIIIFGAAMAVLAGAAIFDIMLSCSAFHADMQSGSSGRKKHTGDIFGVVAAIVAAEALLTGMTVVAISAATISIFFIDFPWTGPR